MVLDEELLKNIRLYIQAKTGIHYFKNIRKTSDNLLVTCPFHKGGQENKPSAGIRLTEGDTISIGTFHCFTCGETMGLSEVIQRLLGNLYNEDEVESRFGLKLLSVQSNIQHQTKPSLFKIPDKSQFSYNDEELKQYRFYHPYLHSRGISKSTAEKYDIGYDSNNEQITFPIRDRLRYCKGIGRRSINKKFYRYPTGMVKPLYGVYELPTKVIHLFVVEGPFNLWSLYEWGKCGVALLGTGTEHQYKELLTVDCLDYVLALDPDEAGRKGINKLGNFLSRNTDRKVYVALLPDGRDVNDLQYEEFRQIQIVTFKEWRLMYNDIT